MKTGSSEKSPAPASSAHDKALSSSEAKQIAFDLLECFPLAFFSLNTDYNIRFCYGKAFRSARTDPNRLIGSSILTYFGDRPDIVAPLRKAMKSQKAVNVRATWQGKFYSAHYFPYFEQQEFQGLHCYVFDHNEVQAPDVRFLSRSEKEKDLMGCFFLDDCGRVAGVNDEMTEISGFSQEELKASGILNLFSVRYERLTLTGKAPKKKLVDCSMRTKSGDFVPVRLQWNQQNIGTATFTSYLVRSLSRDRAREYALDESEKRFQSIAEAAPLFIVITDESGRMTYFNTPWLSFRGRTHSDEVAEPWVEDLDPINAKRFKLALKRALRRKDQFQFECPLLRSDGVWRWVFWKGAPRFANNGEFLGLVCTGLDVTKQKRAIEGLRQSKKDLERSNKELTQFAYAASHDLQEPLRAINGFTDLLASEYAHLFDDQAKVYFQYISDSAKRMKELIKDILAYSRVTSSESQMERVDLLASLEEAKKNLRDKITKGSVQIQSTSLSVVKGHHSQLVQVFQNLIDNAIKYKSAEPPLISIRSSSSENEVIVSVSDNGIGIDPKFHQKIFQIFQRLHTSEDFEGNGIGLSLVQKIIEFHGGRIWVDSVPDGGTCFHFSLPRADEVE